jgi:Kef-type K+ transport system membrane component KefB
MLRGDDELCDGRTPRTFLKLPIINSMCWSAVSGAIVDQRIEHLDRLYKTISTAMTVTSTLSIATIAYLTSLPNNPLQVGDPIELHSFTVFFIAVSIVSYTLGHVMRPPFFRYLATPSLLTALVVPLTIGLVWL